ncbi:hypothetical protein DXD88_00900 [Coprobacillus sp. TM10-10]|jgi:hypothetical protein|uniref:Rpn family recombination-promoting nuclease/putative transposase n=2 Tax=Faecalibacillus intestinalis TaxID=1982626 RepID=A0A7I8E407_9FIRM|nr:hypothetical protein [Faecalibacillus intestinalis]RGG96724.1 hypothetical protein DWW67_01795 [Coprobacillus sp. AF16-47]RGI06527.1 hypothetical protein DXD88_00900 [Coprobacillus sp. TM10-10]BCL58480.1 hypothetical protein Fi14EGH31_21920 [Faecalibacillus intestinalis]
MDTIIKDTLSQHKIMLDQNCKLMISHEEMLSRIIKEFVEEAKHLSIEEIIKIVQDEHRFQRLNNENTISGYGTVRFDFFGCIDLPQLDHTINRIYLNVEIQNDAYPKYSLITRGDAYLSRIQTTQWGKEYNDQNYDGMKKVYLIWILPQAAKKRDGQVSICKTDEEKQLEKVETYDKREQIVIYLDKEHDTNKKYQEYDEVLTPLVVLLNNILDYQGKIRIMKEYGFKEIEKEVREVCDYANILEKEYLNKGIGIGVEKGIEQGTQNERIKNIRKLMIKLKMSFKEAIQFLDIPEDEVKEIEKYFKS